MIARSDAERRIKAALLAAGVTPFRAQLDAAHLVDEIYGVMGGDGFVEERAGGLDVVDD